MIFKEKCLGWCSTSHCCLSKENTCSPLKSIFDFFLSNPNPLEINIKLIHIYRTINCLFNFFVTTTNTWYPLHGKTITIFVSSKFIVTFIVYFCTIINYKSDCKIWRYKYIQNTKYGVNYFIVPSKQIVFLSLGIYI